ncbi:hypothetical protein Patl1_35327 [Pistacia atlantica]|nr:hypothetical protein Patl1_35327 [Pistacia atlantica]
MDLSTNEEEAHEYLPYFRAYKDGQTGLSTRIFIPTGVTKPGQRLHLMVFYHGGGFFMGTPFCSICNNFVLSLVAKADAIVVSLDYRLTPEHYVPIAYEDSWAALKWVASHCNGEGPKAWLNNYANFH